MMRSVSNNPSHAKLAPLVRQEPVLPILLHLITLFDPVGPLTVILVLPC